MKSTIFERTTDKTSCPFKMITSEHRFRTKSGFKEIVPSQNMVSDLNWDSHKKYGYTSHVLACLLFRCKHLKTGLVVNFNFTKSAANKRRLRLFCAAKKHSSYC